MHKRQDELFFETVPIFYSQYREWVQELEKVVENKENGVNS